MAPIQSIINDQFLKRVAAIQKGEKRQGQALAKALSGGGSDQITTTVRAGSQIYARALTGINFGISFLNFTRSDLTQIEKITEKMIQDVDKATSNGGSRNARLLAQRSLAEGGAQIREILQGAEVGDRKYLTGKGIEEVFVALGLDPNESPSLKSTFDSFIALGDDDELADLSIKSDSTSLPSGIGQPSSSHATRPLFDASRSLSKPADAYAVLDDLKAFQSQVKTNIRVVDELAVHLGKSAQLVRATALGFLEISESINSATEAGDVARRLAQLITRDARAALSQAEFLEPIIVATLAYKDQGIVVEQ